MVGASRHEINIEKACGNPVYCVYTVYYAVVGSNSLLIPAVVGNNSLRKTELQIAIMQSLIGSMMAIG